MTHIVIHPGDGTFPEISGDASLFAMSQAAYAVLSSMPGEAFDVVTGKLHCSVSETLLGGSSCSVTAQAAHWGSSSLLGDSSCGPVTGQRAHHVSSTMLGGSSCSPAAHAAYKASSGVLGSAVCTFQASASWSASENVLATSTLSPGERLNHGVSATALGTSSCSAMADNFSISSDIVGDSVFAVGNPTLHHKTSPATASGIPIVRVGTPHVQASSSVILPAKPATPQQSGFAVKVKT
jgi:hypothetical protein